MTPVVNSCSVIGIARGGTFKIRFVGDVFSRIDQIGIQPSDGVQEMSRDIINDGNLDLVLMVLPNAPLGPRDVGLHNPDGWTWVPNVFNVI